MKELVSIIVPVYNVEEYISQCLESVKGQDYAEFEVLIIDDGSTDNSKAICDKYQKLDKRFFVFSKTNGGLSDARNYGLDRANGRYIMFLDSDDYIPANCLTTFIEAIDDTDPDIICGGFRRFTNKGKVLFTRVPDKVEILDKNAAMKEMISEGKTNTMACTKLYKKEIFSDIRFPVGKYHEDIFIMHHIFNKADKVLLLNEVVYFYRVNPASISEGKFKMKRQDAVYAERERYDFICEHYPQYESIQKEFYVWNCVNNNFKLIKEGIPCEYRSVFSDNNKIIKKYKSDFLKSKTSKKAKMATILCLIIGMFVK